MKISHKYFKMGFQFIERLQIPVYILMEILVKNASFSAFSFFCFGLTITAEKA